MIGEFDVPRLQAAPKAASLALATLRRVEGPHARRVQTLRGRTARSEECTNEYVTARLEEAGATLLSLPGSGPGNALKTSKWPTVHSTVEAYGWSNTRLRPAMPEAATITRMDEALAWIEAIPQENYVLRRIVGARALVSPLTGRHLFSWRRIGKILGADPRAVRRWYDKGIDLICRALAADHLRNHARASR